MVSQRIRSVCVVSIALLAWLWPSHAAADVQVWLDPDSIEEGDNTELHIRTNSVQSAPEIDLTSLGDDVEVISNSSNSQLRSIAGRVESWTIRTLTLRPRRTGDISIGPITIGDEVVDALRLRVAPLSQAVRSAIDNTLFFETTLLEDSVYVQAQATYIRKLYYAEGAQLYGDLPGAPEVDAALVVALPEVSPYRETRSGRSYGVLEQRYAIFPEQPGTLTVGGASVTGSIVLRETGRARRRGIVVNADEVSIDVLGVPASYPADAPWFPAQAVRLEQRWDAEIDAMMVGTPVTRRITVSAENATSSLIPPIDTPLGDLAARSYDEAPQLTESAAGTDVIGAREQRTSIVPTASGSSTLPAIEVTWFDTESEQTRIARIAPQALLVLPDPTAPAVPVQDSDSPETLTPADVVGGNNARPWPWILATAMACIGWLLTTILLLRRRARQDTTASSSSDAARKRAPQTVETTRQIEKKMHAAAKSQDLQALRRSLDLWLLDQFGSSLPEATRQWRKDPIAAKALDDLDAVLYSPSGQGELESTRAAAIADSVLAATEKTRASAKASADSTALPGLFAS
ncbi:MAG: BatD family protein [Pseudomonadaceae bacterium]|nr:BatD family protein [Pseudomonadaceae bacterium]